jgi:hypothetical protein
MATEPSDEQPVVEKVKKTTRRAMLGKIDELNSEYRDLGLEARAGNGAAQSRQSEIARELRALSTTLYLREPEVEVRVVRSPTGHPYRIGDQVFLPGLHTVKKSIAQYLLWMMDRNQTNEINRLRSNGEEVDLGSVGGRATMVEDGGRSM